MRWMFGTRFDVRLIQRRCGSGMMLVMVMMPLLLLLLRLLTVMSIRLSARMVGIA